MRSRYLFALLLLLATACSKQDGDQAKLDPPDKKTDVEPAAAEKTVAPAKTPDVVKDAVVEPKPETPKTGEPKAEAPKTDQPKDTKPAEPAVVKSETEEKIAVDPEVVAKRLEEAKSKFKILSDEMSVGMKEYSAKLRRARSVAARNAAVKSNPMIELGPKFVAFAKEYEGTDPAYSALISTTSGGLGEAKTEAMEMLLGWVEADPDSLKSMPALSALANRGEGKPKTKAMELLLATTTSEPGSDASHETLSLLAFTRGDDESKTKAIEQLFEFIHEEPTSDRSVDCLVKFATRGADADKARAVDVLIAKNVNDDKMETVMTTMARGLPTSEADQWLKAISEKATSPKIKATAIFSRLSMLDRLKSFKSFLAGADEERTKAYAPEVIAFVNAERDPNESVDLEKMLEKFIEDQKGNEDHKEILKKAETELFALKYLSVGREAPEIVGLDLDGVEFKLSDYRGKVVFLDFWGDW